MLLSTKDGIHCDQCGLTVKDKFIYYSVDCREITVVNNTMPRLEYESSPILSLDICESCYATIADIVKKNYKATKMLSGRIYPDGIYCDLSGHNLKGSYTFYHCTLTRVIVDCGSKKQVCVRCGSGHKSKTCICGSTSFKTVSSVTSEPRIIELWIDSGSYESVKKRTIQLKQSMSTKWSAGS